MLSEYIREFSQKYKKDVGKNATNDLKSYQILVNKVPDELRSTLDFDHLSIKGSIGQGNTTYYPWVGIFDERVSSGATNGFYIVFLFSDDYDHIYLTLNQGSTRQSAEEIQAYTDFVLSQVSEIPGFQKGRLPEGSLVRERRDSTPNKGSMYEDTNLFYRHYKIDQISEDDLIKHLKTLVEIYQDLAASYSHKDTNIPMDESSFSIDEFYKDLRSAKLIINEQLSYRFVSALISKPFVILTGLSGSGKTKIAQAFCKWLDPTENNSRFILTPVGSDWTNREPLLGYPNALDPGSYVKPDNGVLELLIEAGKPENQHKPYFLILDEMNLSHVERYFADFLSAMESGEPIPIHPNSGKWADSEIPAEIYLPDNLFIIGTVNIDETTYMFSPKVLDRAQVIEFHITAEEIQQFLENPQKPDLSILRGKGENAASDFLKLAQSTWNLVQEDKEEVQTVLENFFQELRKTGAEFGYRTAFEISRFCAIFFHLTEHDRDFWKIERMIDAAVMQKLLPRLHGSRKKLEPVLNSLAQLCFLEGTEGRQNLLQALSETPESIVGAPEVRYPISLEKILRMQKRVAQEGFTSFAEA